jgi:hypothetical protein
MPVCARCTGIYFGAVAGAIASAFRTAKAVRHDGPREVRHDGPREVRHDRAREVRHDEAREVRHERTGPSPVAHGFSRAWARIVLSAAAAPTVLTLAYEWTTGGMPSHAIRAAAGAFIGAAVAWLVVAAADNQVN